MDLRVVHHFSRVLTIPPSLSYTMEPFAVKVKGGFLFCELCQISVRESLWPNHAKADSHIQRFARYVPPAVTEAIVQDTDDAIPDTEDDASSSSSSSSSIGDSEFKNESVSAVRMPSLAPLRAAAAAAVSTDVTALDFEEDGKQHRLSQPEGVPVNFFDSHQGHRDSGNGHGDISGREDTDELAEAVSAEEMRKTIESTILLGIERKAKKIRTAMVDDVGDGEDEDDDGWRSKAI